MLAHFTFYLFALFFIGAQLLYIVVLVRAVQGSESALGIHVAPLFGFPSHSGHHGAFSRAPCALQQVLI